MRPTVITGMLAVVLLGACATTQDIRDVPIARMTKADIVADPAALPAEGYLSTGQPDQAVLEAVADAGFSAVVDLRGLDEDRGLDEQAAVESLGMTYVSLPISSPADATFENAAALQDALAVIDGPVLLHCFSGNRVGALFALSARGAGATSEEALALGKAAGLTRWEDQVQERLDAE